MSRSEVPRIAGPICTAHRPCRRRRHRRRSSPRGTWCSTATIVPSAGRRRSRAHPRLLAADGRISRRRRRGPPASAPSKRRRSRAQPCPCRASPATVQIVDLASGIERLVSPSAFGRGLGRRRRACTRSSRCGRQPRRHRRTTVEQGGRLAQNVATVPGVRERRGGLPAPPGRGTVALVLQREGLELEERCPR